MKIFYFKNIPISYKKFFLYSKLFSNKPLIFFNIINLQNKINFYLKKFFNNIIYYYKSENVFIKNFIIGKSLIIKKINFRAKGRINFYLKRYSNIYINTIWVKK